MMDFKVKDTVYFIRTSNARLTHQEDGIGLMSCKVVSVRGELYAKIIKILYFIGKNELARSSPFYPVGNVMNIRDWSRDVIFHKSLNEAQKEMIFKTFKKKEWLQ